MAAGLRHHVNAVALDIGERNIWRFTELQRTLQYLETTLRGQGYAPLRQTFIVSRLPVSNVYVTLPGVSKPNEILVLGAHYDTVGGSPGANDNGTGVAALLELAQRFAGRPQPRTIRFVAFVNEEPPFFQTLQMGSVLYANAARARGDHIVGMISLETMGYYSDQPGSQQYPVPQLAGAFPDVGNFIGLVSNEESRDLLQSAARAFMARSTVPVQTAALPAEVPGAGWSDHWSFWQAGYPAMMVTDTAPWRYPWYHDAGDTPDKINFEKLADVVDGLENVTLALAGDQYQPHPILRSVT
jgi:Zn-dependent M28 family amino/carboxypeptidase